MPVQQPPVTGDPQQDSFNQQVADALNTMPLGNVITERQVIATDIAGQQGIAGEDGLNRATVRIYQRTAINDENGLTAPDPISSAVNLQYTYASSRLRASDGAGNFVIGPPWEGWYDEIPPRDPVLRDDYIWVQTVNIADRGPTDIIASGFWSPVTLFARPGVGALRAVVEYVAIEEAYEESYEATIRNIYLGEQDVTAQINAERICWLIAETDGTFAVDTRMPAFASQAELDTALAQNMYTDRNFFQASEGPIDSGLGERQFGARRVGYSATFTADEIFANNGQEGGEGFDLVSRDIEPRIEIGAVVNI